MHRKSGIIITIPFYFCVGSYTHTSRNSSIAYIISHWVYLTGIWQESRKMFCWWTSVDSNQCSPDLIFPPATPWQDCCKVNIVFLYPFDIPMCIIVSLLYKLLPYGAVKRWRSALLWHHAVRDWWSWGTEIRSWSRAKGKALAGWAGTVLLHPGHFIKSFLFQLYDAYRNQTIGKYNNTKKKHSPFPKCPRPYTTSLWERWGQANEHHIMVDTISMAVGYTEDSIAYRSSEMTCRPALATPGISSHQDPLSMSVHFPANTEPDQGRF